jgi:hypothetical protein
MHAVAVCREKEILELGIEIASLAGARARPGEGVIADGVSGGQGAEGEASRKLPCLPHRPFAGCSSRAVPCRRTERLWPLALCSR